VATESENGALQKREQSCYDVVYVKCVYRKWWNVSHLKMALCSRGGLEPHFRVLFSAIFQVLPGRISIRVETCGSERKQMCGKLWSIYVQIFYVF